MSSIKNIVNSASQFFGNFNSTELAAPEQRFPGMPRVVSLRVRQLEQQLTFGYAAGVKLRIANQTSSHRVGLAKKAVGYSILTIALLLLALGASRIFASPGIAEAVPFTPDANRIQEFTGVAETELTTALTEALEVYNPELLTADTLAARTALLTRYLNDWHSPLAQYAETIAAQSQWKLILAISFAESGLGKHCADNNCSGIGVAPGHAKWQTYENKGEWAKALNRLLEKRYNNWTLAEMNGVYNQPGSENWLAASTRILNELQARQIK